MRKRMMGKLRKNSTMYYLRQIVACLLVYCILLAVPMQVALAEVVMTSNPAGTITVSPLITTTQAMTATNGAIGYFNDFDIATGHAVTCDQFGVNNNALFKIFGDGTQILGNFTSNGNIYLIDPAGILFGPSSQVNVNKLVASGLNMDNQDFLDFTDGTIDKMKFEGGTGTVTNAGIINATDSAYLVGTQVLNTGSITSPIVVLAAGEKVFLNHLGSNVFIEVADLGTAVPVNNTVNNNSGTINATEQVFLAAGDIFSTAISGVDSLAAVANKDITLDGNIEAGEITLTADNDDVDGGDVIANGTLTSTTGNIEISASDNTIHINEDVTAEVDLLLNNDTEVAADKTLEAGRDVVLAGGKTLDGDGNLDVIADDDIILGAGSNPGDVTADGDLTLDAGHLIEVADGGSITADEDVLILGQLKALGDLTIEATTGGIDVEAVDMAVDDSLLSLTQNNSLHMENALQHVSNSEDTDLSATSTGGSVTSSKADTWKSIEAWAQTFINLNDSDTGGDIRTETLIAGTDILIKSDFGKVYANGPINAGQDVKITAKNEGLDDLDDAIFLYADIDAGRDILLNNNTWAYDGAWMYAGQDVKVGYDEYLDEYNAKTLTGDGELNVEADRHITFGGDVTANGDLYLHADADDDGEGDMTALGSLETTNSDLEVYGENIQVVGTVDSSGAVIMVAADNITLNSNAEADDFMVLGANWDMGTFDFEDDTGDLLTKNLTTYGGGIVAGGQNIDVDGTIDSAGFLIMGAADNITIRDAAEADDFMMLLADLDIGTFDFEDGTGDLSTKSLTTYNGGYIEAAGKNIDVDGFVDSDGWVDMWAADNITLGGTVEADGNIWLEADTDDDDTGDVWAKSSITTTSSDLYVDSENIQVDGYIDILGNIEMYADYDIILGDWVEADYDIFMSANENGVGGVDAGILEHQAGTFESLYGEIDLSAENSWIVLNGGNATEYVTAAEDILLRDDTWVQYSRKIEAGDDVVLAGGEQIHANGSLNIVAGDDIILGSDDVDNHWDDPTDGTAGDVFADGDLTLNASSGSVYAHGELTTLDDSGGHINIYASDSTIHLYDDVTADQTTGGDIILHADTEVDAGVKLDAGNDIHLDHNKTLDGVGELTLEADNDIYLGGDTTAGTGGPSNLFLTSDADDTDGGIIEAKGNITASRRVAINGNVLLTGADGVATHTNQKIEAQGTGMLLVNTSVWPSSTEPYVHKTSDGDLELRAGYDLGIHAHVTVDNGKLDIVGGANTSIYGNLQSSDDMTLIANTGSYPMTYLMLHGNAESTAGSVEMTANGRQIHLWRESWNYSEPWQGIKAGQDIVLNDDTYVRYSDATLNAGQDVILANNEDLKGNGKLTVKAGRDILLGVNPTIPSITSPGDVSAGYVYPYTGTTTPDSDLILEAGDNIFAHGILTATGNITATAEDHINLYNTPTSADADGTLTLIADNDGDDIGDLTVDGALYGNMYLTGVNVTVSGDVESDGTLDIDADENIELRENVSSVGEMTMDAGDEIIIGEAYADDGNVTANSNMTITAGGDWNDDVLVYGKLTTTNGGNIAVRAGDDITIWGTDNGPLYESVDADGALTMKSNTSGSGFLGGDLYIAGDTIADSMLLEAGSGGPADFSDSRVQVDGLLQTTGGDMVVRAHHDVLLGGNVDSAGNLVLNADGHSPYVPSHIYGGDVDVAGTVDAVGTIDMYGNNIMLEKDVTSGGNMTLTADTSLDFNPQLGDPVGDVIAMGNLTSTGGNIEIYSSDDTTYLGGDRVQAYGNILLNNNTEFTSYDDQKVDAQTGMITANGWLYKGDSSLYLEAAGDVSLAKYVTADSGGVSIVSETGTIFTPDEFGDPTDTLNVPISGYSNDETGAGVVLPYGPGKAAIVVISEADLKLGEGAVLTASGMYDNSGAVDDRAGVGFLDDGDPTTATIGGILRDEGDPFDVAIYLASTDGDVDVSGPVSIESYNMILNGGYLNGNGNGYDQRPDIHQGAMVIDAFDSVTFGDLFEDSLADGDVGNRLEVVSRITEWLFQAIGRLPYPYGGGPFPFDYTYVLRGAGLDNPAITDGRAWVLEDPTPPAPLYEEAGQAIEPLTLGLEGCPVLLVAVATELGVPGDTIEVSLANSFALNTDIQPCESCARLLNAATILRDEDGSRMAAMTQMFNDMAPGDSPYTPEMQALIVTAFAGAAEGSQYATVMQYTDAFVQYLAVLSTEMGSPVADGDSLAFIMGKYGAGVLGSDNSNIAAFVAARLESGETFGK